MKLFDVYPLYDITPVKGLGATVYDDKGTKYLDLYGGHAVISIGHSHPHYVKKIQEQIQQIGFYSNAIQNPLQQELADKLGKLSHCEDYQLFLCNSGAEANENALKLASFVTQRSKVIAFKKAFHGRTSAAVACTDNPNIVAPLNAQHQVSFVETGDVEALEKQLAQQDVCAVIFETIQGIGGLDEGETDFYQQCCTLAKKYGSLVIADEIQSGYGRSGDFFAFQKHQIQPDIISMAKGMGNGFPIGGILIHPDIKPKYGMLGTTFGGNYLGCQAAIAVLDVFEKENLIENVRVLEQYIHTISWPKQVLRIKGRGLMIGLEFDCEVAEIRKKLIYEKQIFTGGASNKNILRILPPLSIGRADIDVFVTALYEVLG